MVRGAWCKLLDGLEDRLLAPGTLLFTPTECLTTESSPESDFLSLGEYTLCKLVYTFRFSRACDKLRLSG